MHFGQTQKNRNVPKAEQIMTTELVIAIAYQPGGLESFKRNLAKVIGITEVMSTIGEFSIW